MSLDNPASIKYVNSRTGLPVSREDSLIENLIKNTWSDTRIADLMPLDQIKFGQSYYDTLESRGAIFATIDSGEVQEIERASTIDFITSNVIIKFKIRYHSTSRPEMVNKVFMHLRDIIKRNIMTLENEGIIWIKLINYNFIDHIDDNFDQFGVNMRIAVKYQMNVEAV
jgi:hypothetical protein